MNRRFSMPVAAAAILWAAAGGCAPAMNPGGDLGGGAAACFTQNPMGLTPAQVYAGEVLAYMMQVVVGDAGPVRGRKAWQGRGLDTPLDLAAISDIMTHPEKEKSAVMVLDPDIQGLSEVLYHYDKALNLFKGRRVFDSLYPSIELIALRLMLLQKRHRGEKILLTALHDRETLLLNPALPLTDRDLRATGLNAPEMRLLRQVFASDPGLFRYLKHPFLITALSDSGFVQETDAAVIRAGQQADYVPFACPATLAARGTRPRVTVAVIPSLSGSFNCGVPQTTANPLGFAPEDDYRKATAALEQQILAAARDLARKRPGFKTEAVAGNDRWEAAWQRIVREQVVFIHHDQRPFVILPGTADLTLLKLCPQADLVVVVMGKDVYRSITFNPEQDAYPAVNRIYLDFMDVKYGQVSEETAAAGRFVFERLRVPEPEPAAGRDARWRETGN